MSKTRERIRDSQLKYKQGLGQNFIYDEALLRQLAAMSGVTPDEDVLEIGPGSGSLTGPLCDIAHRVRSVELDERLIPLLQGYMAGRDNFDLVQGDILQLDLHQLTADFCPPFSVVANIPYYITTPLITRLLTADLPLKRLALMVQKEVADKLTAAPGSDAWCMLSVRSQFYTTPEVLMDVPASCFTPPPKVDSAFVLLPLRETPAVAVASEDDFFRVAAAGFALRRKTMTNALLAAFHLERPQALDLMAAADLDHRVRGEALTLEELARLSNAWTAAKEQGA